MYTVELCRHYGKLKNFLHPQVSVYSHEIYIHPSIISTKKTNIFIVKLLIFRFIYRMGLVACTRNKNVVYHLVGRNHLTKIFILETPLKNNYTMCSTPRININFESCTFRSLAPSWTSENHQI